MDETRSSYGFQGGFRLWVSSNHHGPGATASLELWTLAESKPPPVPSWLWIQDKGKKLSSLKQLGLGRKVPKGPQLARKTLPVWMGNRETFVPQEMGLPGMMESTKAASMMYPGDNASHCILTWACPRMDPGGSQELTCT